MNQTTNYQLNQWEKTDRILMEDFNRDNANLETALAGKLGRSQILRTVTTQNSVRAISLRLDDVNWNEWAFLGFSFDNTFTISSETNARYMCDLNDGAASSHCSNSVSYMMYSQPYPFLFVLLPLHDGTRKVESVSFASPGGLGIGSCTFDQLTSLRVVFSSFSYSLPSMTLTLWGVK